MSADPHHAAGEHHEIEMPHASMRDYVIGFVLSVILTAIPFWLVIERPFGAGATAAIIMVFAMIQIVVHMVFFLHMTPKAEGGWSRHTASSSASRGGMPAESRWSCQYGSVRSLRT